jgi:tryptophan-rich sensory protein
MARTLDRTNRRSLGLNIIATLAVAVATNGALAAFGLNRPAAEHWPAFAPPGHSIGAVWVVLFAGMGAARGLAHEIDTRRGTTLARAVTGLICLCLAYPFYTHAIGGHLTELIGNLITLGYATWLVVQLRRTSIVAAALIGLVAGWVTFATVLVVALVQLNGWATS